MENRNNVVAQIVTILTLVHISSANALLPSNWERSLMGASLHELDVAGNEVNFELGKSLILNGRKGGSHASSFLFCEETKVEGSFSQICHRFWVISPKRVDNCGGEIYLAAEDGNWNSRLLLKDQRFRICGGSGYRDDWVQDPWEVKFIDSLGRQRIFRGNPTVLEDGR